jgi:hypothetical protein
MRRKRGPAGNQPVGEEQVSEEKHKCSGGLDARLPCLRPGPKDEGSKQRGNPHPPFSSTPAHALRPAAGLGRFRIGTNLGINGLVSADRSNKATLPLTTPRCTIKSSAKDLSLRIVKLQYTGETSRLFRPLIRCRSDAIHGPEPYSYTTTMSQG